jgi:hypothetical protein
MAKKPKEEYPHMIWKDAEYYRRVPKEGDEPNGLFSHGTPIKIVNEQGDYAHVHSQDVRSVWVPKVHVYRLTHMTTETTPYYFGGPLPEEPPDGFLDAGTQVQLLWEWEGGIGQYVIVRWTEDGGFKEAVVNSDKHPLKPL